MVTEHEMQSLQSFFFDAMVRGWVAVETTVPVQGMPGYKKFSHRSEGNELIDCWRSAIDGWSYGTTTISKFAIPMWVMQYAGRYEKGVIELVKLVLSEAYSCRKFIGGRGRNLVERDSLIYTNVWQGNFRYFRGREEVWSEKEDRLLGFHAYQGMLLG